MNRNRIVVRDRYIREEIGRAVSWTYQPVGKVQLTAFSFRELLSRWRSRDQRFLSRAISKSAGMPRFSVRRLICRMDRVRLPL